MRIAAACGAVAGLHLVLVLLLLRDRLPARRPGHSAIFLAVSRQARVVPQPVPVVTPALRPPAFAVPVPIINVAHDPVPDPGPRLARSRPSARSGARSDARPDVGHAAADGLDMEVTTAQGGGGAARAALGDFEAGVKARIAAGKRQPVLAKDLRNTCLINYTISIDRSGHMVAFHIDPCTVAAINQAARDAIAQAGPFAPPPDLGSARTDVHGSLVFEP